jgi:two-component system NarL family sensor kinase
MQTQVRGPVAIVTTAAVLTGAAWVSFLLGPDTLGDVVDTYLLSNTALALTFVGFGALVLAYRPRHRIGLLFVAFGACYAASVVCLGIVSGPWQLSSGWERWIDVVGITIWIPAPVVCLPLILQLFPNGTPLSRRWRRLVVPTLALTVVAPALSFRPGAINGQQIADRQPLLPTPIGQVVAATLPALTAASMLVLLLSIVSLGLRAKRAEGPERLQVMWLLWAIAIFVVLNVQRLVTTDGPVLFLLTLVLVPGAATVAIVRYELYDIRLIVNRSLVYGSLTIGVVALYIAVVAVLGRVAEDHTSASALAAIAAVALVFSPVRSWLQARVDRLMYGHRRDPVDAAAQVAGRLGDGLDGVLGAVCDALRLPYAAVYADGRIVGAFGRRPPVCHALGLDVVDGSRADLLIGLRQGESHLSRADARVLALLAGPIGLAWQAVSLSEQLGESRSRIVAAREEERRRLRRDLHDGLGSALTAISLKADAAHNLHVVDPDAAQQLMVELRADLTGVIADIRQLVHDLRPQALDELGLVGALRQRADDAWSRHDGGVVVTIDAPEPMPDLPAAVEVAAYRIVSEAVTNVLRHASARRCSVILRVDRELHLEVHDDGHRTDARWSRGVGLASMSERAAELGGRLAAGPTSRGGRVLAVLPLESV